MECADRVFGPLKTPEWPATSHGRAKFFKKRWGFWFVHPLEIPLAGRHWPRAVECSVCGTPVDTPPEARPPPRFRARHQPGAHGIPFHVPAHLEEMRIGLDRKGLVPTLVDMPGTRRLMGSVPPLRVCHGQPAHEGDQHTIRGRIEDEVPVVRHDAMCEDPHLRPLLRLSEDALECQVVGVGGEDRQAGIGSIEDMVRDIPNVRAR